MPNREKRVPQLSELASPNVFWHRIREESGFRPRSGGKARPPRLSSGGSLRRRKARANQHVLVCRVTMRPLEGRAGRNNNASHATNVAIDYLSRQFGMTVRVRFRTRCVDCSGNATPKGRAGQLETAIIVCTWPPRVGQSSRDPHHLKCLVARRQVRPWSTRRKPPN